MGFLYDETDHTIGIVSRNLALQSNFVEFQDYQNFTFFEKKLQNQGTSDHVALPRGRVHGRRGGGGGGGGV